ncbi:MAG: monovalent cation/H(+) antiporter subunit G [Arenicella sp.]
MDISVIIIALCWALAIGGIFFVLVGALGLLRSPDVYTRIHAASLTDTGGASLMICCMCLYAGAIMHEPMVVVKLILTYFFIMFTGPTASHAVAKTALMNELGPIGKDGRHAIHEELLKSRQLKILKDHDHPRANK